MTIEPYETVVLVLAPDYGRKLKELCARADVWAVESTYNRDAAIAIWNGLAPGKPSPMTVFDWEPHEVPSDTVLRMLDTIEEHHPYCATIEIVGASASPQVLAEMGARGYSYNKPTIDGFVASKHAL